MINPRLLLIMCIKRRPWCDKSTTQLLAKQMTSLLQRTPLCSRRHGRKANATLSVQAPPLPLPLSPSASLVLSLSPSEPLLAAL